MSDWRNSYLVAGIRLEIASTAGDPSRYISPSLDAFLSPGPPDLVLEFQVDELAQADPLKRFFPPQFVLTRRGDELIFSGRESGERAIGAISTSCDRAEMGLPALDRPWRISEEEEAVREAVQAFVKACVQCRLALEGGTFLHAAGIIMDNIGYTFVGHTRAGKTTLARGFPAQSVLGDDLVAVQKVGDEHRLFGTPWSGREGDIVSYAEAPLGALFMLHPELQPGIHALAPAEAVAELVSNAPLLGYEGEESKLLEIFSSLAAAVPIFRMSIQLGDDVAGLLHEFISGR